MPEDARFYNRLKRLKQGKISKEEAELEIVNVYEKGILSLLETPKPKEEEPYLVMILNNDKEFYNCYIDHAQRVPIVLNNMPFQKQDNDSVGVALKSFVFENKDLPCPSYEKVEERMRKTEKYRKNLKQILSKIEKINPSVFKEILKRFSEKSAERLKNLNPDYYKESSKYFSNLKSLINIDYDSYYEFLYQDYIWILCSFIKYFTNLEMKIELLKEDKSKTILIFYGSQSTYKLLGEFIGYDLQIKPYAFKYAKFFSSNKKHYDTTVDDAFNRTAKQKLLGKPQFPNPQFCELDLKSKTLFPPFYPYKKEKEDKYRKYEKNDDYHDCINDPDFSQNGLGCEDDSSIFRNIDKLRVIDGTLKELFHYSMLQKVGLLNQVIYKRNYLSYGEKLSNEILFYDSTKMFTRKHEMNLINTIRNYYGEYLSFYFLWVMYFCKWTAFPSVIGIIVFSISVEPPSELKDSSVETIKGFSLRYYDIMLIIMCIMITVWASIFLKSWKQREKMFAYIWGMENYEKKELVDANFKPNKKVEFVFGENILTVSAWSANSRKFVSFLFMVIIVIIRVLSVLVIFSFKRKEKVQNFRTNIIYGVITGVFNKIMSMTYDYLAKKLSLWENYEKYSQQQNSLAVKLILFEFVNNYSNLLYIAFVKPIYKEECLYNNCFKELEIQLYILLLINFSFNLYEIFAPLLYYRFQIRKYRKSALLQPIQHSLDHQLLCVGYRTLIYEYNERIINFGFICLFSVFAPLTPMFVLMLTYLENYVDLYKLFNLVRVEFIDGANGIEIYNSIFKTFYFVGMITSIALILLSRGDLMTLDVFIKQDLFKNSDFISRFLVFVIVENVILLFNKFIIINLQPFWFEHLDELKSIYYKKYYILDREHLPHVKNRLENNLKN